MPITKVDIVTVTCASYYPPIFLENHTLSKAYKMLGILRCTFSTMILVNSKEQLYISLIFNSISYVLFILTETLQYLIKCIQQIECIQQQALNTS